MIERRWIPSTSALLAFESAARQRNFSRAAEELNTSQSAISRHIATLEGRLAARLFARQGRSLTLTSEGDRFYRAVLSGLETVQSASMAITQAAGSDHLTLACTHEISHLFLLPRFDALQALVGEETRIRVMTIEYETLDSIQGLPIDLVFTYRINGTRPDDRVVAQQEVVTPVCSPGFAEQHGAMLAGNIATWEGFSFLELTRPNQGWATWHDWFDRNGRSDATPNYIGFGNYVYLLEAAAAGRGLALGWQGMVERYLEAGTLVTPIAPNDSFDGPLQAVLTSHGRDRPVARACLSFFKEVTD